MRPEYQLNGIWNYVSFHFRFPFSHNWMILVTHTHLRMGNYYVYTYNGIPSFKYIKVLFNSHLSLGSLGNRRNKKIDGWRDVKPIQGHITGNARICEQSAGETSANPRMSSGAGRVFPPTTRSRTLFSHVNHLIDTGCRHGAARS